MGKTIAMLFLSVILPSLFSIYVNGKGLNQKNDFAQKFCSSICATFVKSRPFCKVGGGKMGRNVCVECLEDITCVIADESKPVCDVGGGNVCVECTQNNDCTSPNKGLCQNHRCQCNDGFELHGNKCIVACQDDNDEFYPVIISGKCYRISKTKKSFDDAKKTCSSLDAKLLEPKTKAINEQIATEATNVNGNNWCWIGINDKGTEGKWVYTSDGQEISWSNWYSGQPNDDSSVWNCAVTQISSGTIEHGKWFDVSCTAYNYYFICEF